MKTQHMMSLLLTLVLALGTCFTVVACFDDSNGNEDASLDGDVDGNQNGDENGDQNGDDNGDQSGDDNGDQNGDDNGDQNGDDNGDQSGADMAHPACTGVGGTCTEQRWVLCPVGTEPVDPDPHQDCGINPGTAGWCCVDAPPSTCSDAENANCVAGTKCEGCWASVPNLSCEAGRVCCMDICD